MQTLHQGGAEVDVPKLPGRIPSLDGLRAISILLVFIGHGAMSYGAPKVLAPFHHFGNFGVRFFFIISGFLITTLLLKELKKAGRISLKHFYIRRALRIFPAAFGFLAVMGILWGLSIITMKPADMVHALTYTMNYHEGYVAWVDHLWSLSVEEQFYLLWPGLLVLAGMRKAFRGAWLVVLAAPILRACMWYLWGASESGMTKHFESVADALATGCLLSVYFNRLGLSARYMRLQSFPTVFLSFSLGLVLVGNGIYLVRPEAFYILGQTLANVGTVLCIDWTIRNHTSLVGRLLNTRLAIFVGGISYSLYLWQNSFLLADIDTWATKLPLNVLCAVGAALLSYWAIEQPFLRLKSIATGEVKTKRAFAAASGRDC